MYTPLYSFWYLFATNGSDGFLLDLFRQPGQAGARLVTYRHGHPPRIARHGFRPEALNGVPGDLGVTLGGIAYDAMGCRGAVAGTPLDTTYTLSGRGMRFVPAYLGWLFDNVPSFESRYGAMRHGRCGEASYDNVPVTCSSYSLDDFTHARWVLISAPRFPGSDLAFEISAARLAGRWMPSAWVFYQGREYRFNSTIDCLFRLHVERAGDMQAGARIFQATVRGPGWKLDIEAEAPLEQFARLESDRNTEIHTTLFGTCRARCSPGGPALAVAERTCLLEVKDGPATS